jgi:hypothetical protein
MDIESNLIMCRLGAVAREGIEALVNGPHRTLIYVTTLTIDS